jgi:hypothetical protein
MLTSGPKFVFDRTIDFLRNGSADADDVVIGFRVVSQIAILGHADGNLLVFE